MTIDAKKLEEAILTAERWAPQSTHMQELIAAAREHLQTLPRTKEVEVWHVEFTCDGLPDVEVYSTRERADKEARDLTDEIFECVRVTGPHKHVVPA